MNKTAKWLMVASAAVLVGAGANALYTQYTYQNNGGIATVGVSLTDLEGNLVTSLDWGILDNDTAYVWDPLNVTNISNVPINLTLSTASPSGSIISLSLTWNYTAGTVIAPTESVIIELTQTVTATGDWSYTTVIEAESVE